MTTTIDKAGRVVIPAPLRVKAGFKPGTVLHVSLDDAGIRLERVAEGPVLVKVGKRLIARPRAVSGRAHVDVAAVIEAERRRPHRTSR